MGRPLFDRHIAAPLERARILHQRVKGDAVFLGQPGDRIGADLVDNIAVSRRAVGADDDGVDFTFRHHLRHRAVGDQ